jgi:hypothetical protein
MRRRLGLPGSAQKEFLGMAAWRQLLGSFSKSQSLFGQAFLKGLFVLDAASLLRHSLLHWKKAGAQWRSHHR